MNNERRCPNCNSLLQFIDNKYTCEYCESSFSEDDLKNISLKHSLNIDSDFDLNSFTNPTEIIPFNKSKEDFLNKIKENTYTKFFIPSKFKKNKLEDIKMVYVPFYLFDIKGEGDTILKCTDISAKVKNESKVTTVNNYKTTVESKCDFIKLPICANKDFDKDILVGIEPFNNEKLIDFNNEEIKDIELINTDIDISLALHKVSFNVKKIVNELVMKKTEHKISVIDSNNTNFNLINCKLVYYPIFYLEKEYNDERYYYSMNGENGKFDYDIPLSNIKMVIGTIIFIVLVFLVIFLLLINL